MSTTTTNKTITAIRYLDSSDSEYVYLGNAWENGEGGWRVTTAYTLDEAMDITGNSIDTQMALFTSFQEYFDEEEVEMVRVQTTIETEDLLDAVEGEFKEMRQRIALNKLTERDIKALGIVSVATYIKTKYHNA